MISNQKIYTKLSEILVGDPRFWILAKLIPHSDLGFTKHRIQDPDLQDCNWPIKVSELSFFVPNHRFIRQDILQIAYVLFKMLNNVFKYKYYRIILRKNPSNFLLSYFLLLGRTVGHGNSFLSGFDIFKT
jgi:hypothetical protein